MPRPRLRLAPSLRWYGQPGSIQTGPVRVDLCAGPNLVQLSYTDGCGGSGGRVGVFRDACYSALFDPAEVEATVSPERMRRTGSPGNGIVAPVRLHRRIHKIFSESS